MSNGISRQANDARPQWWRIGGALAAGAGGGAAAAMAGVPLPWMLGSMGACLVLVLIGLPLARPKAIVDPMRMVLGVMLGSTLTPELLTRTTELAVGIALLVPYIVAATAIGLVYFRVAGRFDRNAAFFSAMPGGIFTMTAYAEDVGADVTKVALIQSARIILVVATLPFAIRWLADTPAAAVLSLGGALETVGPLDAVLLLAAGIGGWLAARAARVPGAAIAGPMFASAALHLTGVTAVQPPAMLVIAAQVVLGTSIGTRFSGTPAIEVLRALWLAAGYAVLMLGLTVTIAALAHWATGVELYAAVLAYAPGGLTEMSLVALGLGFNVGYVATLHFLRILFIVFMAPTLYRLTGQGSLRQAALDHNRQEGSGR